MKRVKNLIGGLKMKRSNVILFLILLLFSIMQNSAMAGLKGKVNKGVIDLYGKINDDVKYRSEIITTMKEGLKDASTYLYNVTKKQNRLGKIIIIVPSEWSEFQAEVTTEDLTEKDFDMKFPDSDVGQANVAAFGKSTGHIDMGLKNSSGSWGRIFIHEFGHYGYGLWDEYLRTDYEESTQKTYYNFKDSQGNWLKCTDKVTWITNVVRVLSSENYSVLECSSPEDNTSCVMWHYGPKSITNFCYKDHDTKCNNDQNYYHGKMSCWGVLLAEDNKKFGLKAPDDTGIVPITYEAPTIEFKKAKSKSRSVFSFSGGTDSKLYTFPAPVRISAALTKDETPVYGADAYAKVTVPDGTVYKVSLNDRGLKGDDFACDGNYGGYFVDFSGDGTYRIDVTASNPQRTAVAGIGLSDVNTNKDSAKAAKSESINYDFECNGALEPFNVQGYIKRDMIPPGQIDQLEGIAIPSGQVYFTWIAPGNNMYDGNAYAYEMRYSAKPIVTEDDWNKASQITGLSLPKTPGEKEEFTSIPLETGYYYFALRAMDKTGLKSEMAEISMDVVKSAVAGGGTDIGSSGDGGGKGSCFIATAAYGSYDNFNVKVLRGFRDNCLLNNAPGRAFVKYYYTYSPSIAKIVEQSDIFRFVVRIGLYPIVFSLLYPWAIALLLLLLLSLGALFYKKYRRIRIKTYGV